MKKLFTLLILGMIAASSLTMAQLTHAYGGYKSDNAQFHPRHEDYYDGNQRLKLRHRANIERASASNVHADPHSNDYYRCDWQYNKNMRTWVCEKKYAKSAKTCPSGYVMNASKTLCNPIRKPASSNRVRYAYNGNTYSPAPANTTPATTAQPVQVVATKYIYYYGDEEDQSRPTPNSLPSTGSGIWLFLSLGAVSAYSYLRRRF